MALLKKKSKVGIVQKPRKKYELAEVLKKPRGAAGATAYTGTKAPS